MNKKQREAKRKNAQAHQKKAQELNKERLARINSPEYKEQMARRKHYYAIDPSVQEPKTAGLAVDITPQDSEGRVSPWTEAVATVRLLNPALFDLALGAYARSGPALEPDEVSSELDTLTELQRELSSDSDFAATLSKAVDARVRHSDVLEGGFQVIDETKRLT